MTVYDTWEKREKAETKKYMKQILKDNKLSYGELKRKSDKLANEHIELKNKLEELEGDIFQTEYLRIMVLMTEMLGVDEE